MSQKNGLALVRVVFLALLATVLSSGALSAVDYSGKFTLPNTITWGSATLPPGEYIIKFNPDVDPFMMKITGPDQTVHLFPSGWTDTRTGGESSLVVLRRGKKGIVRSLVLADRGKVFTYNLPKNELPIMANEPQLIQRIPVVIYGK